jgi:DNA-directed RNA polymerase specialized sigma24 family protein
MIKKKRTPMDLIDDIYSLAYWMTGSEASATELVNKIYLHVDIDTPERELFKTFRDCYFERYGHCVPALASIPVERLMESLLKRDADIKLSVLLSAISGLKHRAISKIIGKPLGTVRIWLSTGRKSLAEGILSFDATLFHGVAIKRIGVL